MTVKFKINGVEYTAENAAQEDTLESIEQILKKSLGNGSVLDPKAQNAMNKALNAVSSSGNGLADSFDTLNDSVDDADKSFSDVVKNELDRERRREKLIAEFKKNIAVSFFSATTNITKGISDAVYQFTHNLQSASDAQSGVAMFSRVIDSSISLIAEGIKTIANAIPVIGGIVGGISSAVAEGLKFLNQFYAQEMTTLFSSFEKIGSEGVLLSRGMTELKNIANNAGMGVSEFSDSLVRNADTIRKTGLGMTDGTIKFGQVLSSLRNGTEQYSKQLFALGYSTQDQADVVAFSMSALSRSTNIQKMSADEIARDSYDYAKNLKIISDITGKTAKQQMEAQQAADLNLAVQNKLAQMGPGAVEKFNAALAATPESMHKALEQQLVFGSVIDQQSAIIKANNREVANAIDGTVNMIGDSTKTSDQVRNTVLGDWADANETIKKSSIAITASQADLAGVSGMAGDLGKAFNNLYVETVNYTKDGIADANKALKQISTNTDPLTSDFADLSLKIQQFKADLENYAIAGTKEYGDVIKKSVSQIQFALNAAGIAAGTRPPGAAQGDQSFDWYHGPKALQKSPQEFSDDIDTKYPWLSAIDRFFKVGPSDNGNPSVSMADGGIASGSTNGFAATLHGTEAVVPLPGGKSIPVDFNLTDFNGDKNVGAGNTTETIDVTNKKILSTLQVLVDSFDNNTNYTKQIANMSFEQAKALQVVADQIDDSNSLLNKIYKTSN
jgi:hypothetical protein